MNRPSRRAHCATLFGALPLFVASCATLYPVDVKHVSPSTFEERDPVHVEILEREPDRSYFELATLSTQSQNYDSPAHAITRLRQVAASLGADALLIDCQGARAVATPLTAFALERDFGFATASPSQKGAATLSQCYARAVAIRWRASEANEIQEAAARIPVRPTRAPEPTDPNAAPGPFFPTPAVSAPAKK